MRLIRYGHSQVRGEYKLKEPTPLVPLFGLGQGPNATDMRGFTPIDYDRLVDWSYFVPMPGLGPQTAAVGKADRHAHADGTLPAVARRDRAAW